MKATTEQRAALRATLREMMYWRENINNVANELSLASTIASLDITPAQQERLLLAMCDILQTIREIPSK